MGEESKIEWTHHTFNPWWGCQRVSPGCEHCYAETFSKRLGLKVWGPESAGTPRRFFGDKHWNEPLKWNEAAAKAGERHRVFCASMADVFEDRDDLIEHRERLFRLIDATPHLDWLLLTKRPENIRRMMPLAWRADMGYAAPSNVWLGTTAEDQQRADERIPELLACSELAAKLFVSYEPALGPLVLREEWLHGPFDHCPIEGLESDPTTGERFDADPCEGCPGYGEECGAVRGSRLDWIIVGGESGPGARPFDLAWARSTIRACREAGVSVFVKQLGANACTRIGPVQGSAAAQRRFVDDMKRLGDMMDRKGGDMSEWPEDLRVREYPTPQAEWWCPYNDERPCPRQDGVECSPCPHAAALPEAP